MSTTTTPDMNLTLPIPLSEPGPAWASEINTALTVIDAHDHSIGKGVPITPAGMNITANLTFNGFQAIAVGAVVMALQSADPTSNLSAYVKGADLYYKDGNGNVVRITSGGAVAGTPGSIANLVSPASASFISLSGTFQFQQNTNVAGNGDFGTMVLRYPGSYPTPSGTNYIALQVPASIGAGYAVTLPGAPPVTNTAFVTMDTAGTLGNGISTVQGITQTMLAPRTVGSTVSAGGVALSSSSGSFSIGPGSAAVTNLSVTITTTGRPVYIALIPDGVGPFSSFGATSTLGGPECQLLVLKDGVQISTSSVKAATAVGSIFVPPSFLTMSFTSAGTYTYAVYVFVAANNTAFVSNCQLVAYEI